MQESPEGERPGDASHEALLAFVGARIREARKRAKLRQSDLAKAIGSSQGYIFQIEAGEANVTLKTLVRICSVVGGTPRDLLPREHSDRIAGLLHTTMQEFDRVGDRLRQLQRLLLNEPDDPTADTPPDD